MAQGTAPQDELVLAGEFPSASREQWQRLAEDVLRRAGTPPEELAGPVEALLASTTYDGITVQPLYTAVDALPDSGPPGQAPFVRGRRAAGSAPPTWDIRQRYADPDPVAIRQAVLADLEHGVTSLWLVAGQAGVPVGSLADVLDGVYVELAGVTLDAGEEFATAAPALLEVYQARGLAPGEISGNLGADPLGVAARSGVEPEPAAAAELATRVATTYPGLRAVVVDALPYHEAGGSDAEELGCAVASGITYLRALTEAGLSVDAAAGQLEFRLAATADQFLTIAKFRAARRLWARVVQVCGGTQAAGAAPQHAVTSWPMMTRRDPWVNMLRTTLACFGAGVGGADAITVLPFDSAVGLPDAFARRIARNTQTILLEESTVAVVADPAGGSWYVERLTDELARAAWAWFTDIERAGGMVAALGSGLVADRIAATWQARSANLAARAEVIVGVTEFPNPEEQPLSRPPAPPVPSGGLPRIRYAETFEEPGGAQ
jgi:methylmalonyl-CoA mutase